MKKTVSLILCVLFLWVAKAYSNDSTYYSFGAQLYPVQNTKIELIYEKLDFTYTNGGVWISAYLEFSNQYEEQELMVGFETPAFEEEAQNEEGLYTIPKSKIDRFKILFNDQKLDWKLHFTSDRFGNHTAVYTFTARFKPGNNKIHHTYIIYGMKRNAPYTLYSYRLSTGNRWANQKIGLIDISINMGKNAFFSLPVYLENSQREIFWRIRGNGQRITIFDDISWNEYKINDLKGINYFDIKSGSVYASISNLQADYDLKIINFVDSHRADQLKEQFANLKKCHQLHLKALAYYRQKKDEDAVNTYEEALEYAGYPQLYYDYANSLSNIKDRLEDAISAYRLALEDYSFSRAHLAYYNLACAYSRKGDLKSAYACLKSAIISGYRNKNKIENDPDLFNLRKDSHWSSWWKEQKDQIQK